MHSFIVTFPSALLRRANCVKAQLIALLFPETIPLSVHMITSGLCSLSGVAGRVPRAVGPTGCWEGAPQSVSPMGWLLGQLLCPHLFSALRPLCAVNQNAPKVIL